MVHGRAVRIKISLSSNNGEGTLIVRDNGVGLSKRSAKCKGIGLHTMDYRARLIGGSLEVRPRSQGGTAVICTFPLAATSDFGKNREYARDDS